MAWLCDLDGEKVKNAVAEYGGKGTQNFDDLLNDPQVELVTIATPAVTHAALAKQALQAGKHVLLEKPITASVAEADELIAVAKASKRVLCIDHQRRFFANQKAVQNAVAGGQLGRLLSVRVDLPLAGGIGVNDPADPATFQKRFLRSHIYDYFVHHVDQICVLLGEKPTHVYARSRTFGGGDVPAELEISLTMPSGVLASASMRCSHAPDPKWSLDGEKATLRMQFANDMGACFLYQRQQDGSLKSWEIQPPHRTDTLDTGSGQWRAKKGFEVYGYHHLDAHDEFYQRLFVAIRNGGPAPASAEDARDAIKIVWLAMESARTGQAVKF
jgi:scyllo-inositol 2-dehydrogenase (NADP+)